jgi:hypothetical protein
VEEQRLLQDEADLSAQRFDGEAAHVRCETRPTKAITEQSSLC